MFFNPRLSSISVTNGIFNETFDQDTTFKSNINSSNVSVSISGNDRLVQEGNYVYYYCSASDSTNSNGNLKISGTVTVTYTNGAWRVGTATYETLTIIINNITFYGYKPNSNYKVNVLKIKNSGKSQLSFNGFTNY